MKIIRSSKCGTRFATDKKKDESRTILQEYSVEALKKMGHNGKLKHRLSKNIRRSIGSWNWKYWLGRLEQQAEWNRVSFRTVSPHYTSQTCPACSHADSGNRDGEVFRCQKCGYTGNTDIIASRNILSRFLTGPYGTSYKPENKAVLACPELSSL